MVSANFVNPVLDPETGEAKMACLRFEVEDHSEQDSVPLVAKGDHKLNQSFLFETSPANEVQSHARS